MEIVKKNWYSYMVLRKKLKVFIGTVGMIRGKKFIIFMVQLARSWVQLARKVKILWVTSYCVGIAVREHRSWRRVR